MSVYRISFGDQGTVAISVDVDLFALSRSQRDLLFGLIDNVKSLDGSVEPGAADLIAELGTALGSDASVTHLAPPPVDQPEPSTTSSPAGDKRRRTYSATEKEVAVLAGKRHGPTKACRDLGISSKSLLRHWTQQYDSAGGIPPTWHRNGKPGPASADEARGRTADTALDKLRHKLEAVRVDHHGAAMAQLAKSERAEYVEQLDATEREVLAAALEREGVDLAAVEREALPVFPDAGPMGPMPVVENRARDAAAEALYDGM